MFDKKFNAIYNLTNKHLDIIYFQIFTAWVCIDEKVSHLFNALNTFLLHFTSPPSSSTDHNLGNSVFAITVDLNIEPSVFPSPKAIFNNFFRL